MIRLPILFVTTFFIIQVEAIEYKCTIDVSAPTSSSADSDSYNVNVRVGNFNSGPLCHTINVDNFAPGQSLPDTTAPPCGVSLSNIAITNLEPTLTTSTTCNVCQETTYQVEYTLESDETDKSAVETLISTQLSFFNASTTLADSFVPTTASGIQQGVMDIKRAIGGTMDVDYDLILFTGVSCRTDFVMPAKIDCLFRAGGGKVDPFSPNKNDKFRSFNVDQTSVAFSLADLAFMRQMNSVFNISEIKNEAVKQGFKKCANILIDKTDYSPDKFFTPVDLSYAKYIISGTWTPSGINFDGPNFPVLPAQRDAIFSTLGYYDESAKSIYFPSS